MLNKLIKKLNFKKIQELELENESLLAKLRKHQEWGEASYHADFLKAYGRNMAWLDDPKFRIAYSKGMDSGHKIARTKGSRDDIHIEWRVHIAIWAAHHALRINGDLVECGVNTGILSLAICNYVDMQDKKMYLFDTYEGIPTSQMNESEKVARSYENQNYYEPCFEVVQRNFAAFPNVKLIKGIVPESLKSVNIECISYLHIDMNIVYPEIEAIKFFWDKISLGGVILLDDYGWAHYSDQQKAMDEFAESKGVKIACLPTGQGLLIKS
jgi:O-methyltransferase